MKLPDAIVKVAVAEIGVLEVGNTNCGVRVNEYKSATWLPSTKGWAWCAAFVCWVIREAAEQSGVTFTKTFKRPRTAGAWDFENWSLDQDNSTQTKKPHRGDIQAGDIVIFKFSHIGFAISAPDAAGMVTTVEGNTNAAGAREGNGVWRKKRHISQIRSRIRFKV